MPHEQKPLLDRQCDFCKTPFQTRRENKRFCSEAHRMGFQRQMNRAICPHCGGNLYPGSVNA